MTNRHTEIETRVRNEFDNIADLDENDWASIKYDAYIEAYNNVNYSGIFEKFGIDEQTEVFGDEFGVDIARNVKDDIENQIGEEGINAINSELTEDYFDKYESEIRSGIERWLIKKKTNPKNEGLKMTTFTKDPKSKKLVCDEDKNLVISRQTFDRLKRKENKSKN